MKTDEKWTESRQKFVRTSEDWINAEVVILFKKGNITNIENYHRSSLLLQKYKLFTRIRTNRLTYKLDFYQPTEQEEFRKRYITVVHLSTVRVLKYKIYPGCNSVKVLIERITKYNVSLI